MEHPYPKMEEFADPVSTPTTGPEVYIIRQLLNPLRVTRTLIQLGYEPLPPKSCISPFHFFTWNATTLNCYPNVFVYTRHLFRTCGFWNVATCGFASHFIFNILGEACHFMIHQYVVEQTLCNRGWLQDEDIAGKSDSMLVECMMEEAPFSQFTLHLLKLCFLKTYEVFLTQPFYVIMVRQAASLIGGEARYSWLFQAVCSIYKDSGLLGFFSGLTPRLIFEVARLALYLSLCRVLRRRVLGLFPRSSLLRPLRSVMDIFINIFFYRLDVVSCVMAVHGSRLALAAEANSFTGWRDCKRVFASSGQLSRGFWPFWRMHVQNEHLPAAV
ncbi:unnamed protein product [Mesocestoides corti]|uniref:Mitochondrial carrier homolog 2 n=1 Tax=Mesocestoides corti TaxID=53468 RepID=A0A0R3UJB6_MESCO|nr:unnamed protein product [Mesocestoides corti]